MKLNWGSVKQLLHKIARYTIMTALALTGVGLIYLLAKTVIIKEGYQGISYNNGKRVILEGGKRHCLLSPFHIYEQSYPCKEIPASNRALKFRSRDGILSETTVTYSIQITQPATTVAAVEGNIEEVIASTITSHASSVLEQYDHEEVTSDAVSSLRSASTAPDLRNLLNSPLGSNRSRRSLDDNKADSRASSPNPEAKHSKKSTLIITEIRNNIKDNLKKRLDRWGVKLIDITIGGVRAVSKSIREVLEEAHVQTIRSKIGVENFLREHEAYVEAAKANVQNLKSPEEEQAHDTILRHVEVQALSSNNVANTAMVLDSLRSTSTFRTPESIVLRPRAISAIPPSSASIGSSTSPVQTFLPTLSNSTNSVLYNRTPADSIPPTPNNANPQTLQALPPSLPLLQPQSRGGSNKQ